MDATEAKQKVFDLLLEQPTLGIATDQEIVDLIYAKFGKVATLQQVTDARTALKELTDKEDVEAIPRPEAYNKG